MNPNADSVRRALDAFHSIASYLRGLHGPEWLDLDLTIPQLRAFKVICTEGPIHGRGLARALNVGQPTVSKLVDQLVERGFARREEDRDDRRVVWLHPTAEGRARFERLALGGQDRLLGLLGNLNEDEFICVCRALDALARAAEHCIRGELRVSSTEA